MKRKIRTEIKPSIFTNRNNASIKLLDRYEYVALNTTELHKHGGSRDANGQAWKLNSIIADESGEILRQATFH